MRFSWSAYFHSFYMYGCCTICDRHQDRWKTVKMRKYFCPGILWLLLVSKQCTHKRFCSIGSLAWPGRRFCKTPRSSYSGEHLWTFRMPNIIIIWTRKIGPRAHRVSISHTLLLFLIQNVAVKNERRKNQTRNPPTHRHV